MSTSKPLRLRTCETTGYEAMVMVNGVPLQVDEWNLRGPRGPEIPVEVTLTFIATIEPEPEPDRAARACAGCLVHVRAATGACLPGYVEHEGADFLQIDTFGRDPRFAKHLSGTHDESRKIDGSWHWPREDCSGTPESTPDAPGPVTVNVEVRGSIVSEKDIAHAIEKSLRRHGRGGFTS